MRWCVAAVEFCECVVLPMVFYFGALFMFCLVYCYVDMLFDKIAAASMFTFILSILVRTSCMDRSHVSHLMLYCRHNNKHYANGKNRTQWYGNKKQNHCGETFRREKIKCSFKQTPNQTKPKSILNFKIKSGKPHSKTFYNDYHAAYVFFKRIAGFYQIIREKNHSKSSRKINHFIGLSPLY